MYSNASASTTSLGIRRKPAPKLSDEELSALVATCSASSTPSLPSTARHSLHVDHPYMSSPSSMSTSYIPQASSRKMSTDIKTVQFAKVIAQERTASPSPSVASVNAHYYRAASSPIPEDDQEDCGCGGDHDDEESASDSEEDEDSEEDHASSIASKNLSPRHSLSSSNGRSSNADSIFDTYPGIERQSSTCSTFSSTSTQTPYERKEAVHKKLEAFIAQGIFQPERHASETSFSSQLSELRETWGESASKKVARRPFDQFSKPDVDSLHNAAELPVLTEHGEEVRFGDYWQNQRTLVCFIRHYWCPSCQDYMASIMRVTAEQLAELNLKLLIVGCGSYKMIAGYRKLLGGCEFDIVTDPTRAVYRQFGMTRNSFSAGKRGSYIQHGMAVNTAISLKRNLAMPLKDPGSLGGLGGEFVLGPGMDCSFAHRMKATRDHAELHDILKAIGLVVPTTFLNSQPVEQKKRITMQRRGYSYQPNFLQYKPKENLELGETEERRRESV